MRTIHYTITSLVSGVLLHSLVFCFLFSFIFASPAFAAANTIKFQGKIVNDSDGTNLVSGSPSCIVNAGADTCDFRVRIYDASSGGTLLFTETHSDVEIGDYNGVFNLDINSVCNSTGTDWTTGGCISNGGVDFSDPSLWIELDFDPDGDNDFAEAEIFSRTQLVKVPHAYYADRAGSVSENGNAFIQGGNLFGSLATLGTNDNFNLAFETNGSTRLTIDTLGNIQVGSATANGKFEIVGTNNDQQLIIRGNVTQTNNILEVQDSNQIVLSAFDGAGKLGLGLSNATGAFLDIAAPTTSLAQINLTPSSGINKSSPLPGDLWFNGTNLNFRRDGFTTVDLLMAGLFTDAGTTTYLTSLTDDFAIGSTNLIAPFSVDESTNTVRIGEGSGSNGTLNMFASNGATGSIAYDTADGWSFTGGNIGIGMAPNIDSTLSLTRSASNYPSNLRGITNNLTVSGVSAGIQGLYTSSETNPGLGNTISSNVGLRANASILSPGTLSDARAGLFQLASQQGVITNAYTLYIAAPFTSLGGTIQNSYGLYVENQTAATNDYGVYIAGADTLSLWVDNGVSRFDGNVLAGTTTNTAFLNVAGSTASQASIRLLTGSTPAAPNSGDLWWNGGGLFFYNGSSSIDLLANAAGTFVNFTPASAQNTTSTNSLINLSTTANTTNPLININELGAGTPDLVDLKVGGSSLFKVYNDGSIGIGTTVNTARVNIAAATTSKANIRFVTSGGVNPTSSTAGDMWWNGTNLYFDNGAFDVDILSKDATSVSCTACVANNALKTTTGAAIGTAGANITMNDYSFFPNAEQNGCTAGVSPDIRSVSTNPVNNSIGRFQIGDCASGVWAVTWRYITASRDQEIFSWFDTNTNTLNETWIAEIQYNDILPLELITQSPQIIPVQAVIFDETLTTMGEDPDIKRIREDYTFINIKKVPPDQLATDPLTAKRYAERIDCLAQNNNNETKCFQFLNHPDIYFGELVYCPECTAQKTLTQDLVSLQIPESTTNKEIIEKAYDLTEGDVVSVNKSGILVKAEKQNAQNVLGIVSNASFANSYDSSTSIAVSGKVLANISEFSADINPGDYITISNELGLIEKATQNGIIIGKALESWTQGSNKKSMYIFINIMWYGGFGIETDRTVSKDILSFAQPVTFESIEINKAAVFKGKVYLKDELIVNKNIAGRITIPAGSTSAVKTFDKSLTYNPVISITPRKLQGPITYYISDSTKNSFTIELLTATSYDLTFDWIALQVSENESPTELNSEEEVIPDIPEIVPIDQMIESEEPSVISESISEEDLPSEFESTESEDVEVDNESDLNEVI